MIYTVALLILLLAAVIVTAMIIVNVRRHREISGRHRLENRPELPKHETFPEFHN
jgi:cell division protein FtsL